MSGLQAWNQRMFVHSVQCNARRFLRWLYISCNNKSVKCKNNLSSALFNISDCFFKRFLELFVLNQYALIETVFLTIVWTQSTHPSTNSDIGGKSFRLRLSQRWYCYRTWLPDGFASENKRGGKMVPDCNGSWWDKYSCPNWYGFTCAFKSMKDTFMHVTDVPDFSGSYSPCHILC